ncbi:MAG: hypothetical protein COB02_02250 [Candidatus Cloacimonadota bacterium]|nr:MAG: hypothetical protein COB02_02250 [Candidatus Cloacimonadota bacterium]
MFLVYILNDKNVGFANCLPTFFYFRESLMGLSGLSFQVGLMLGVFIGIAIMIILVECIKINNESDESL